MHFPVVMMQLARDEYCSLFRKLAFTGALTCLYLTRFLILSKNAAINPAQLSVLL